MKNMYWKNAELKDKNMKIIISGWGAEILKFQSL